MPDVRIVVSLPFLLRVDPSPYRVNFGGATWSLTVERVPQAVPDQRLAGPGSTVDLVRERSGRISYSKVTGIGQFNETNQNTLLYSFVGALNRLIVHARDLLGDYWIHAVDGSNLHRIAISVGEQATEFWQPGRGGIGPIFEGLSPEADAKLQSVLDQDDFPPLWREIHLDAHDALDLERESDAALLGWSALETACRTALPGLADAAGMSPLDLAMSIDPQNRTRWRALPPYSHEDAVMRVSGGLQIVEQAAELSIPRVFNPNSVKVSVRHAYHLRNRIAHQGLRINRFHAEQALAAVDYLLTTALSVRGVQPPPAVDSWKRRFRRVRPEILQFISSNQIRLVVAYPDETFFQMERLGNDVWVRVAGDVSQSIAACLLLAEWEAWRSIRRSDRPRLKLNERFPNPHLLPGIMTTLVDVVNQAACFAEALIVSARTNAATLAAAKRAASDEIKWIARQPLLDPNDVRITMVPVRIAQYLSILPLHSRRVRLHPIRQTQPEVYRRALRWADLMAQIDPESDHGRCNVLRTIHTDCIWLDTILVRCPTEGKSFGGSEWPLD